MRDDLKKKLGNDFVLKIDENDKQTILFEYPVCFDSQYLVQSVRLEIGMLAAWTPSDDEQSEVGMLKALEIGLSQKILTQAKYFSIFR